MKKDSKIITVLWHILAVCIFISIPYFTISLQAKEIRNAKSPPMLHPDSIWATALYLRFCVQNMILSIQFYFTYLFLAPKFLNNKKNYFKYILLCILTIFAFIYIIHLLHMFVDQQIGKHTLSIKIRVIETFLYSFAMAILGTTLYLYFSYNKLQKIQQESELQFLRSQISPHFLFNSLNNIYSLIVLRSEKAAEAMLRLSDMLRFVLYESSEKYIKLTQELRYIDDYISLQRLRLHENVEINYRVLVPSNTKMIHPMLLIPFIENAFKHGISYSEPCKIDVLIYLEAEYFKMTIKNSIHKNKTDELKKESGIGLSNVKRRLDLLYNGKYDLKELNDGTNYEINITLVLHET